MEVHHHPDTHHTSKKWKEYLLEFFMIFLAVTMGFIAENIREHRTERAKEKQYIAGFIRNVEDDTAMLSHVIAVDERLIKGIDSMLMLAHVNMATDSNCKSFYYFSMKYFFNTSSFKSNDATLQQLKSTGDYRLIERDHVADSLAKYDADIHSVYGQGEFYDTYFKDILSRLEELGDMTAYGDSSYVRNGKMTDKPFPPLRTGNGNLPTFFSKVFDFRIVTSAYAELDLKPQLARAGSLIAFLKKEYAIDQ
jgi:hypothetical protein